MNATDDHTLQQQMQPACSTRWESLNPTSFKNTLYIPQLKISVTAGSFVRYDSGLGDEKSIKVGRVVDVVTSINFVPGDLESHPLIRFATPPDELKDDMPVQYAKVNIFQDRQLFSGDENCKFPLGEGRFRDGWKRIVQLDAFEWIPSYSIVGLAFIAFEDDDHAFDDCKGMSNFYVTRYRISRDGDVSIIPKHTCPPFPGRIKSFRELWSVDHCELLFKAIQQIRQEMQRVLCRVAQSQGDFAVKNTKLHLPSCSWYFIKNAMAVGGVDSISTVKYSQPQGILSWGLSYNSRRRTGYLDVLRFDTETKLDVFRGLFGKMAGYGVRKKRPRYSDGPFLLSINDVVNAVCPSKRNETDDDEQRADSSSVCSVFQRFGVTEDGIDLAYDSSEGTLQILLRYRKIIVTNESLHSLSGAGVCYTGFVPSDSNEEERTCRDDIIPGMEFIDGNYVMQINEVRQRSTIPSSTMEIHAMKVYKILDDVGAGGRTTKVHAKEIVVYRDVESVYRKIQEMLE